RPNRDDVGAPLAVALPRQQEGRRSKCPRGEPRPESAAASAQRPTRRPYAKLARVGYRISVDTGGTFTDVVVADEQGRLRIGKALTDAGRAFASIEEGLAQVAPELGLTVPELLAATDVFTYG